MTLRHLARRFLGAVIARPLGADQRLVVEQVLLPVELRLFDEMSRADQSHAFLVLRRFDRLAPNSRVEARRAALLHDVGKSVSNLGTFERVVASIVGPRTPRYADYHAHEALGAELLERVGSHAVTVDLLRNIGDTATLDALRRADEV